MRFHILGLAHIPTNNEMTPCAYTGKVVRLCSMLKSLGHTVIFYGSELSRVDCDEFVPVLSEADRIACYGDYDWRREFFRHDPRDAAHQTFNRNAITAILERAQPRDFLLCSMGNYQKDIADAVGLMTVESGIGYEGIFARYKVFESYYWQAHVYGLTGQHDGNWYDRVIQNYYDVQDFPAGAHQGDYFLFCGRLIRRKGLDIAVQVTRRLGVKLIVAGQGSLVNEMEGLKCDEPHVEHVGTVNAEQRAALMGGAIALFSPSYYLEPFGGVTAEAMLCGTPCITTDWGAYAENIVNDVNGQRCHTFDAFLKAALWASDRHHDQVGHDHIRQMAIDRFDMNNVKHAYQQYFTQLSDLWDEKGWYAEHE